MISMSIIIYYSCKNTNIFYYYEQYHRLLMFFRCFFRTFIHKSLFLSIFIMIYVINLLLPNIFRLSLALLFYHQFHRAMVGAVDVC